MLAEVRRYPSSSYQCSTDILRVGDDVVARALEEHLQVQLLWYGLSARVFALAPAHRSLEFTG